MKKIVILYSGGLDSYIMKRLAEVEFPEAEVECVYYRHGADSEETEISLLPGFVKVMDVNWLGSNGITGKSKIGEEHKGNIYIPGRNMVFATLAAAQFLPDEVWLGSLVDEVNHDATDKNDIFRHSISGLLSYVLSPFSEGVRVSYPLAERRWTKTDALQWAMSTGLFAHEIAENSSSCWHSHDGKPCGECWQCVKRMLSFRAATQSFHDVEQYVVHPLKSKKARHMLANVMASQPANADERNMHNLANDWLTAAERELVVSEICVAD